MSKVLESEFFLSYCILDLQNQIEFYALTLWFKCMFPSGLILFKK